MAQSKKDTIVVRLQDLSDIEMLNKVRKYMEEKDG